MVVKVFHVFVLFRCQPYSKKVKGYFAIYILIGILLMKNGGLYMQMKFMEFGSVYEKELLVLPSSSDVLLSRKMTFYVRLNLDRMISRHWTVPIMFN